jgi:hypothetical protein
MGPTVIRVLAIYIHIHTHIYRVFPDVFAKAQERVLLLIWGNRCLTNHMSSRHRCRFKRHLNVALNIKRVFNSPLL